MVQNGALYDENYCIDDLCILEFVKMLLRHLVNPIHIFSDALLLWIRNVSGFHIDETSIRPQIVISTVIRSDDFCNV